jgi:RNA polymerase sigma-70 factor (ECF subfamily)
MSDSTDEEIAIRVQGGDDQMFGDLMRRYERKITRFGRRFLSVDEDIEDTVQEIFVKAFINIQSFDPRQRFSPWIYRIAHNHLLDTLNPDSAIEIYNVGIAS